MSTLGQAGGTLSSNTVGDCGAVGADAAAVPENSAPGTGVFQDHSLWLPWTQETFSVVHDSGDCLTAFKGLCY